MDFGYALGLIPFVIFIPLEDNQQSWWPCVSAQLRRSLPKHSASLTRLTPLSEGLAQLTSNEYLVLAGTLHGIHAITSRLSPTGSSSGAEVIEGESFKLTINLTLTGMLSGSSESIWAACVYQELNSSS